MTNCEIIEEHLLTGVPVKEICNKFEKQVLQEFINEYKTLKNQSIELPCIIMFNSQLDNGKMAKRGQDKNGLYGVVYKRKDWECPVVEICGFTPFDNTQAKEKIKQIREKENE